MQQNLFRSWNVLRSLQSSPDVLERDTPPYSRPMQVLIVLRIDPLHFLAGCCKRRLNQALSVIYFIMLYTVLLFIRTPFMYC